MQPKISLFASAVRPHLWESFFKSLEGTSIPVEVVFAGNTPPNIPFVDWYDVKFKYITTDNIKPAQCYEIARRECTGELVSWTADDCEYPNNILGKAYEYYEKMGLSVCDILSLQSKENYGNMILTDMSVHSFFGGRPETPRMSPLGIVDNNFLDRLGGIDRRFVCGQYENDIVMRLYEAGGTLFPFGDKDLYVEIDHVKKHGALQNHRPFAEGYKKDREVLESRWVKDGIVSPTHLDNGTEKFEDADILTKSQSNCKNY